MKKKILKKAGVIAAFSVFGLLALGSGSGSSSGNEKKITTDASVESSTGSDEIGNSAADADSKVTITEQVLVEENGLKITAMEFVNDSIWGEGIKLLIENDSDKNLTVGCDALIVNDYMMTDLFASSVHPFF